MGLPTFLGGYPKGDDLQVGKSLDSDCSRQRISELLLFKILLVPSDFVTLKVHFLQNFYHPFSP